MIPCRISSQNCYRLTSRYQHRLQSVELSERQDSFRTSDRSRFGLFSMKGSFARTPAFRRSEIGMSRLTNRRTGASRTGSSFSMPTSLPGFQMNKQHLVTRFVPGMPLSHGLLAQRPLTFWTVKRNGWCRILEFKINTF
jgi:hypothetical protein